MSLRSGPRCPPIPSSAWQLRQFLYWNTSAPCNSAGERCFTKFSGTGSRLHAVSFGDHGAVVPSYVSAPSVVYATITNSTAAGRRLGARSPRLLTNGTKNNTAIRITGKTSMINVSAPGGLSESNPKSHKNGHSGRGLAPARVGSGGPVGPLGPRIAAIVTTAITASEENKTSFKIASPRN